MRHSKYAFESCLHATCSLPSALRHAMNFVLSALHSPPAKEGAALRARRMRAADAPWSSGKEPRSGGVD